MNSGQPPVAHGDTIAALSSGALPSGVAVVRLSGTKSRFVLETIAGSVPPARVARRMGLSRSDGSRLDDALVLFFQAPASFTGEDVAEFHVHGGRAVVAALLEDICDIPGCRLAEAGEFTRRAFVNGKIDLLGAEASADLVGADTEAQRRFAALAATGGQARLYDAWRVRLMNARAMIEAELDFSDQEDVRDGASNGVWADIRDLVHEIEKNVEGFSRTEILRDGYQVVLIGPPNAGKSSLLNVLARRDVAIVTDEPGTTRDALDVALELGGVRVVLTDTAGIREGESQAEKIGVERSLERARTADLLIVLEDVSEPSRSWEGPQTAATILRVGSKIDKGLRSDSHYDVLLSSMTGKGVDDLLDRVTALAVSAVPRWGEVLPWRQRHVDLLRAARESLLAALDEDVRGLELRAEHLRLAGEFLGRITGRVDVEDLLGAIFSSFCIGK